MKAYFGGQIKKGYRDNLAAIITRNDETYSVSIYPIGSEEYVYMTGVGTVDNPIERAYIGLSQEAGEMIARSAADLHRGLTLWDLDSMVVMPHFVRRDQPQRIVLEAKDGKYQVVE